MNKNLPPLLKIIGVILGALVFLVLITYFLFGRGGEAKKITWGVSFDPYYAQSLGLDWKSTYLSLLDDFHVKHLRLAAFWEQIEPEKGKIDFSKLDFQVKEAEKRNAKIILAVGRRLPRWPECHVPSWAKGLPDSEQKKLILGLVPQIVNRYKNSPALEVWQVENEFFVDFFGNCPPADENFLDQEIALVRRLDPYHPILITESGEGSTWLKASGKGDILGVSIYRTIFIDQFNHLWKGYYDYFLPAELYRIKVNFWKALGRVKTVWVTELQAEPFLPVPTDQASVSEMYRTMSPQKFRDNIAFARSTGFDRIYLWGAEWWFYMRERKGISTFYDEAKKLWKY